MPNSMTDTKYKNTKLVLPYLMSMCQIILKIWGKTVSMITSATTIKEKHVNKSLVNRLIH